jgi:pimeloyl-ACP methyl ester carboxylesterase
LAEQTADPANDILLLMNWTYIVGCREWNSDLGDDFRQNFETDIPTLIVQSTWDMSTPYENALELVPFFKNSKFVSVVRGPHTGIGQAMNASEQFRTALFDFAATGDMSRFPEEVMMPPVRFRVPQ